MTTVMAAVAGVVVLVVVALFVSYNRFVHQRQYLANAWSNVDTELRRRYDLIPNLVETVQGYASHERTTLTAVIEARTRAVDNHGEADDQARDEQALVGNLKSLLAVAESYPELKASEHFLDLQRQLAATEDRIQAARRFFNNNVRDYNRRVQSVPSMITARLFHFAEKPYFEVDPVVRENPGVPFQRSAPGKAPGA
jgi:LemA protein